MSETKKNGLVINNGKLKVTVSTNGGELQSIQTEDGHEWLWQGDATYWSDRAPNLFPYVGRLWNNQYQVEGNTYPLTIHGFIHQQKFQVESLAEDHVTLAFCDIPDTRACYPYRFQYSIDYRIVNTVLEITYQVKNRDIRPMYFGIGGHPGFRVPLEEGSCFEEYYLQFEAPCCPIRVGFSEPCFVNGEDKPFLLNDQCQLPLNHTLFDDDAIVLKNCGSSVVLQSDRGKKAVKVQYPGMPYLGIWHQPHTDAPYVCLEPWVSLPSQHGQVPVFEKQTDLIMVQPGGEYENCWSIEIFN